MTASVGAGGSYFGPLHHGCIPLAKRKNAAPDDKSGQCQPRSDRHDHRAVSSRIVRGSLRTVAITSPAAEAASVFLDDVHERRTRQAAGDGGRAAITGRDAAPGDRSSKADRQARDAGVGGVAAADLGRVLQREVDILCTDQVGTNGEPPDRSWGCRSDRKTITGLPGKAGAGGPAVVRIVLQRCTGERPERGTTAELDPTAQLYTGSNARHRGALAGHVP